MSTFITKAACRGRRPASLLDYNGYKRPHLVARLLKERDVPRFIVAPDGYGKTSIALEYAETVFEWSHVFWINCQSPCFIRDLDAVGIAPLCFGVDGRPSLVVFDAVPLLDAQRSQMLSREIDMLLERSCEVIVTCTPTCDVYASIQRDRVRLSADDLLLTDEEVDTVRTADERMSAPAADVSNAHRVAALAWGPPDTASPAFLKACFGQEMPGDLLLVMVGMSVLVNGCVDDLGKTCSFDVGEVCGMLGSYPHLCFDPETQRFSAPLHPVDDIAKAAKKHLGKIVECSPFESRDELARAWAETLVERGGMAARACDVVRELCSTQARPAWLEDHAFELVKRGCFYGTCKLVDSMRAMLPKVPQKARLAIAAVEAVSLHVLGNREEALRVAKRFGFGDQGAADARICCLLVAARDGSEFLRQRALDALRAILEDEGHGEEDLTLCEWAAHAQCACLDGPMALGVFWEQQMKAQASDEALCLTASWLFESIDWRDEDMQQNATMRCGIRFDLVERYVLDVLDRVEDLGENFFVASAGLAMEQAHARGMAYAAAPIATSSLLALRKVELAVLAQRRRYERDVRDKQVRKTSWSQTHPDSLSVDAPSLFPAEVRNVPVLTLKLFGRFEASIGDAPIDHHLLKRQNVRTLIALLAVNRGHELMRETLAKAMWPESDPDSRKKNFYSAWSQLKKALSLPDGTCPYLVRHQYGCSLEDRFVQTDVQRFDDICRELLFGNPDLREWPLLYGELERDFSGELMPSNTTNAQLAAARADCKVRLIDALISAAQNVIDADNAQWGIWFARAAVKHDPTREDAYVALMRAQIAADQRTAAMMTYLKCRRVLSEELGMDPSAEAMALYQSLLDAL